MISSLGPVTRRHEQQVRMVHNSPKRWSVTALSCLSCPSAPSLFLRSAASQNLRAAALCSWPSMRCLTAVPAVAVAGWSGDGVESGG